MPSVPPVPADATPSSALASDLSRFLDALADHGRATVGMVPPALHDPHAIHRLARIAERAAQDLGLTPPPFSLPAAEWAARMVYQLAQCVMIPGLDASQNEAAFQVSCPTPRCPETDWSVDLTLRHLPRLSQIARMISLTHNVLPSLQRIALAWPLSSIGMHDLVDSSAPETTAPHPPPVFLLDSFIDHPALRRLYSDRILATSDVSRLGDPRVDDQLRADLGLHPDLAPRIAARLIAPNPSHP